MLKGQSKSVKGKVLKWALPFTDLLCPLTSKSDFPFVSQVLIFLLSAGYDR